MVKLGKNRYYPLFNKVGDKISYSGVVCDPDVHQKLQTQPFYFDTVEKAEFAGKNLIDFYIKLL